ncbi:hypothetical protein MLD38_028264 [Melastoma candidum]|uniref:Uncharacterized protein n=1 Tax=Melastoma candidum TaxID=119954 RepID=A0ACB9N0I6_9MYRT|nr:hypothetical protein MLD38_028264 [Melastoma candidum]
MDAFFFSPVQKNLPPGPRFFSVIGNYRFICSNRVNINISSYGPTWWLFCSNLASKVLHSSRLRSFSKLRRWSLDILLRRLGVWWLPWSTSNMPCSVSSCLSVSGISSRRMPSSTNTTSTALQRIMANMVKHLHIQEKAYEEIRGVVRSEVEEIEEDHLENMPFLKDVVLEEGLWRHSPGHLVLLHAVTEDAELNEYMIPKNGNINFMVAKMGRDPKSVGRMQWSSSQRFLNESSRKGEQAGTTEAFDITGSRKIKMMPFRAGRRICPGYGAAILHLEYFLANPIWRYQ